MIGSRAAFPALALLAGCAELSQSSAPSGSPNTVPVSQMTAPCVAQAAQRTGLPAGEVIVTDRLETGGGPLLTLLAGSRPLSCRLEADGSVTVVSEFAN